MFPKFINIRQHHKARPEIKDIPQAVRDAVNKCGADMSGLSGNTVGIAVGSRGIKNIDIIVKSIVDEVRHAGGIPVVFAAMGSHGGGTAKGQREVLEALGVTEESVGCEIRTGTDSVYYGIGANGTEVFANPIALEFDKIILINRIKMHTDFEDVTESGIYKLMAVGLGNPKGAGIIHACSHTVGYGEAIRNAGNVILNKLPVLFALAVTENWKHETDSIEAILPENLLETEKRILKEVKAGAIALPLKAFDILKMCIRDSTTMVQTMTELVIQDGFVMRMDSQSMKSMMMIIIGSGSLQMVRREQQTRRSMVRATHSMLTV